MSLAPPKRNSLEIRLFQAGCWAGLFLIVSLLLTDIFFLEDYTAVYIEGPAILIFLIFLKSSYGKNPEKYIYSFLALIILILDSVFFFEKGWTVPSIVIYFIGVLYGSILTTSRYRFRLAIIHLVNFGILTIIEQMFFKVPKYYGIDISLVQNTHIAYAIVSAVFVSLMIRHLRIHYDQDQALILAKNEALDETQQQLQAQNADLKRVQKQILLKQEELNRKNDDLAGQNEEIEKLNVSLEELVKERSQELSNIINELNLLFYRSSHDFRRPLTTMIGLSNVARHSKLDKLTSNLMELVGETAETMKRTLDKYIVLYQIIDMAIYPVMYLDEVERNIAEYLIKNNVDYDITIKTEKYLLNDRRNHILNIIIYQLIENCCLFRKNESNDRVEVKIIEDNGVLNISVWDNGQGIPEDVKHNIFNIYYRGNPDSKGCGLGLHVVKTAVDKLDGKIEVIARKNECTQFDITIKI
ncbi:MAG: HAMP domain-containing sensor histidine kinase [Bacteroidota bacterium]